MALSLATQDNLKRSFGVHYRKHIHWVCAEAISSPPVHVPTFKELAISEESLMKAYATNMESLFISRDRFETGMLMLIAHLNETRQCKIWCILCNIMSGAPDDFC